jgi:hypothetical protein
MRITEELLYLLNAKVGTKFTGRGGRSTAILRLQTEGHGGECPSRIIRSGSQYVPTAVGRSWISSDSMSIGN